MRKIILAVSVVFVVLVCATISYILFFTKAEPKLTAPITAVVPEKIAGWTTQEIPLAETEGMQNYVGKLLQFDQYISRVYKKDGLEIIAYIAYWEPGGKTPFDAGGHNPDSCWVRNGWAREARAYSVGGKKIDGRELLPYESGVYEKDGDRLAVVFWHLVNGKPFIYKTQKLGWREGVAGAIDRIGVRMEDFKRLGLNQRREQMFIRLSFPNQDLEKVWANPDFQAFLLSLTRLGIFEDEPWH